MQNLSECSKHTVENCAGIVLGLNSLPSCSEPLFDHGMVNADGRLIMCCKTKRDIKRITLSSSASKKNFSKSGKQSENLRSFLPLFWFNFCYYFSLPQCLLCRLPALDLSWKIHVFRLAFKQTMYCRFLFVWFLMRGYVKGTAFVLILFLLLWFSRRYTTWMHVCMSVCLWSVSHTVSWWLL